MHTRKLGIIVSHPIQYYAPLFRYLAIYVDLEVFYGYAPTPEQVGRVGFGVDVTWGVDLLHGYPHRFLHNIAQEPSSSYFRGIDTPDVGASLQASGVTHVLIMGWQLKSYWQAFIESRRKNIPVAVRGDSNLNPKEPTSKRLLRRCLYPLFLRRYTRIFYVGARNREYLLYNGAQPNKLLFAPHAVDQSIWSIGAEPKRQTSTVMFVWVAKFIAIKRPQDVIVSFKQAMRLDHAIELLMVGAGELADSCKRMAEDEIRIRFLGFKNQKELRDVYASADCLILTSDHETWGLVVNEAMAVGLPVIASDTCGCVDDLVDEGRTGYSYRSGDTVELTRLILKMADTLRQNRNHFCPHIAEKNTIYSFATNLRAIQEFMDA